MMRIAFKKSCQDNLNDAMSESTFEYGRTGTGVATRQVDTQPYRKIHFEAGAIVIKTLKNGPNQTLTTDE